MPPDAEPPSPIRLTAEERRVLRTYERLKSLPKTAEALHLTRFRVRTVVMRLGAMRPRGAPRISPEEIARRKRIGATVTTWEEYGRRLGIPNPKMDRRLGVRLKCWVPACKRVSAGYGYHADPRGVRRALCAVHLRGA